MKSLCFLILAVTGAFAGVLPPQPSAEQIRAIAVFSEPLVPVGTSTPQEDADLASAVNAWAERTSPDDYSALEDFLSANGTSPWALAVRVNLADTYYKSGRFGKALAAYEQAWNDSKADAQAKRLTDTSAAGYLGLLARVGRFAQMQAVLEDAGTRSFEGSAGEKISQAKSGLYEMLNVPGKSFKCGPIALSAIEKTRGVDPATWAQYLFEVQSPQNGFSLHEVWQMSETLGMNMQMAFREPGSALILPAVVHWKLNHYGALTAEESGRYHLQDATFVQDFWPTTTAIDDEGSGYFLVPAGALPAGWRTVGQTEAEGVRGMGNTQTTDTKALGPNDTKIGDDKCPKGMPRASVHAMLVSLHIEDIPVGYRPPVGPAADFTVSYSQRDITQSGTLNQSSLGPKWTLHWLSYVTYNPNSPSAGATLSLRGGGQETYTGFSSTVNTSAMTWASPTRLWRSAATGTVTFQRLFPDGSKEIFEQDDGVPVTGGTVEKRVFLTQIVDPRGNALTLAYDTQRRIVSATDSFGLVTTVDYEDSDPYKITKVTDPYGRLATFEYNAQGRLWRITDTLGLQSTFAYDGDFITAMTTPYGTTGFAFQETNSTTRWLETTDPQGSKERVEYRNDWPGGGNHFSAPASEVPATYGLYTFNQYLDARNTFFWDKKAFAEAAGDYTKARVYHWLHTQDITMTDRVLESTKEPFSSRIWFNYIGTQDQYSPLGAVAGTTALPTIIARNVTAPGGGIETQAIHRSYNAIGNLIEERDPIERTMTYTYDANMVDLLSVSQQGPSGPQQVFAATYNSQHLPLTVTDASGQTTTYSYNAKGQPLTITDAKGGVTTLSYNTTTGFLTSVDGPQPSDTISMTSDAFGRIATITDSDGYSLAFEYDAMDRPTKVTFPDGTTEKTTYDRLSISSREDRLKRVTRFWHNSLGQMIAKQDPAGRWSGYDWCKCGDLRQLRDALGRITKWKHDVQGRVTAKVYPDNTTVTYGYDLSSRMASITDPLGQVQALTYNRDDTVAVEKFVNAINPTPDVTFAWNSKFRRIDSMTDGTGTTSFTYHPFGALGGGRLASVDGPLSGDTVTMSYDELGRPAQQAIAGIARDFVYDAGSRLTRETNPLGQFDYTYEGATRRVASITAPNGLLTALSYLPNAQDRRLASITHTGPGASAVSAFAYGYDANGGISEWTQSQPANTLNTVSAWSIEHDAADQLTGVSVAGQMEARQAFSYDPAGNRLTAQSGNATTIATFNNLNEIQTMGGGGKLRFSGTTSEPANVSVQGKPAWMLDATSFTADATVNVGTNTIPVVATDGSGNSQTSTYQVIVPSVATRTFNYDPNGNLLNDGERTYMWDAKNRLIRATSGADTHEWAYNGLDQRVSESKNGVLTKRWVWAGGNQPAEERNASGNVMRRFYPQGEQVWGTNYYYTRDHLGSIREVLDSAGSVVSSYGYDAWGRRTLQTESDIATFGFTGHMEHPAIGLVLTKYRLYDPGSGRWTSRDPLGENGGINLLSYVGNDPVNLWDPLGLWQATISAGYFYAGRLSFGYNEGKANFGLGVGLGLGAKFEFNPNDKDPNKPSNADSCQGKYGSIKLGISGGVGSGPLGNVSGELAVSSKADDFDNVHAALNGTLTAAEPIGGNRVGGTLSANLYGSGSTGEYMGNIGVSTTSSVSAGGMIFGGVSAGVSW